MRTEEKIKETLKVYKELHKQAKEEYAKERYNIQIWTLRWVLEINKI